MNQYQLRLQIDQPVAAIQFKAMEKNEHAL